MSQDPSWANSPEPLINFFEFLFSENKTFELFPWPHMEGATGNYHLWMTDPRVLEYVRDIRASKWIWAKKGVVSNYTLFEAVKMGRKLSPMPSPAFACPKLF